MEAPATPPALQHIIPQPLLWSTELQVLRCRPNCHQVALPRAAMEAIIQAPGQSTSHQNRHQLTQKQPHQKHTDAKLA
ncbi:hypothetical protein V2J09_001961 [Rumex salicifolius]